MLVLSRKRNEAIYIGDNITIVIVEIRGDKVRLGIEAPPKVPVHRQEVYEAIQRSGRRQSLLDQPEASLQDRSGGGADGNGAALDGRVSGTGPVATEGVLGADTAQQIVEFGLNTQILDGGD